MIDKVEITEEKVKCLVCNDSFSLEQKGMFVSLCKCKNLRIVRCRTFIEISSMLTDQSKQIQYKI